MPFFYQSGEQIKAGDHVSLHREPAQIEFIADRLDDPHGWFCKRYGGGVMVVEPNVFGRLFIEAPVSHYEDLQFVSRSS
jgi:hypothetical protein